MYDISPTIAAFENFINILTPQSEFDLELDYQGLAEYLWENDDFIEVAIEDFTFEEIE